MATMEVENDQEERQQQSLLVQALDIPSLNHGQPPSQHAYQASAAVDKLDSFAASTNSSGASSTGLAEPFMGTPRHSDYTIHTSNIFVGESPEHLDPLHQPDTENSPGRRSVFGGQVHEKYGAKPVSRVESSDTLPTENHDTIMSLPNVVVNPQPHMSSRSISDLTPPHSPIRNNMDDLISPLGFHEDPTKSSQRRHPSGRLRAHETIHAQSLLLGFAFMAIWSPQNVLAPNLTEIADQFGFTPQERDFYLGANVALATGVFSLPISAGIGILADVWNRKHLFVLTVGLGGLCSWATGASPTYRWLFFARLLNGGCMSGSVPVAFSLLGDLFHTHERNAASSGLTAMMGLGIIAGQVYAGVVGSTLGWPHAFYVSSILTIVSALLVFTFVMEPVRGGKEQALQDMLKQGTRYERKLTWAGFLHAMRTNKSNGILMWQGFFSSVPWGIIFVFLNDYLSQERGFSVPDATFIVFVFGLGCAAGGVLGGYWGQLFSRWNRSYLPLFMAATTFLGIFPFVGLLNGTFTNAHGWKAVLYSFMGGCVASLPSVNVRPCIINVNPPETRGAALTAANLIINLARGAGPSCITVMGAIWHVNRRFSFNVTLAFFWVVSALQLLLLTRSLPHDQDAMEAELAEYAESRMQLAPQMGEEDSIVSIEERMTSFDAGAARESIQFMGEAFREIGDEIRTIRPLHNSCQLQEVEEDEEDDSGMDKQDLERRRRIWIEHQLHRDDVFDASPSPKKNTNGATQHLRTSDQGRSAHETTPLL